jgi:NMD protein affecting ribosome stability and mRNA decay
MRTICRLCGEQLKQYERPEGVCDRCLRSRQTLPRTTDAAEKAAGRNEP